MTTINYKIKTHKTERTYELPHFFILNKGLNSGRPMRDPCANCFVVTTETEKQRESLFYLCLSLQIGRFYSFYLKGSVILFITIDDTREVLNTALLNYKKEQWQIKVEKLKKIIAYEENLKKQLSSISKLKNALLRT